MAPQLHFTLAGNEVLKISIVESTGEAVMLQLEGQISGKWVDLLQLTTEEYLYREARLFLDLSKVRFVDRGGIALLQKLVGHQVAVLNASPFIAQQIAAAP
ncbi:MAG TPA: STAS domain-containing protein [Candidatus Acidoferrum sp.]|nr:STAS domain-containing protein [Candidatus Acidoferrum sp.]